MARRGIKRKTSQVIGPTPERMAKGGMDLVATERAGIKAHRVQLVSRYDLLRRQNKLTRDEHSACEHFERQYRIAYGADCLISRYDKGVAGGAGEGPQPVLAAVRQLSTVMGPRWHWLVAVIIEDEAMRVAERRLHVCTGTGLANFKAAIKAMTDFWGMPNEG